MNAEPHLLVEDNQTNRAFVEAVNARARAEARLTTGKAVLLAGGGVGLALALMGIGVAAGLWGYAQYNDASATAERLADAIKVALESSTITTRGEVKLANGGTIRLEDGSVVKLDPNASVALEPGGTVRLADGSMVRIDGLPGAGAGVSRPTASQLSGIGGDSGSNASVVTNFTVFKEASFGAGKVVSGWMYKSNEDTRPHHQYCYYTEPVGGVEQRIDIAQNGKALAAKGNLTVDRATAVSLCRWFDGTATNTASIIPAPAPQPVARGTFPMPSAGAKYVDWKNWCSRTYDPGLMDWCMGLYKPPEIVEIAPAQPRRQGKERMRMDPRVPDQQSQGKMF